MGPVTQMYEQCLDAVKGWFDLGTVLDKTAQFADAALTAGIPSGRVAVLNNAGKFVVDRANSSLTAPKTAMPIFLWTGSTDADVYNDGKSASAVDSGGTNKIVNWISVGPANHATGLVATGKYELQTTEFDTAQSYYCNSPLTSSTAGKLTSVGAVQFSTWICGICSKHVGSDSQSVGLGVHAASTGTTGAVGYNAHGIKVLTFWSYFLPAR